MQVTNQQVRRSLAALESSTDRPATAPPQEAHRTGDIDVPPALLETLRTAPTVRPAAVARARARLTSGRPPSARQVADQLVGRMVCDRLR